MGVGVVQGYGTGTPPAAAPRVVHPLGGPVYTQSVGGQGQLYDGHTSRAGASDWQAGNPIYGDVDLRGKPAVDACQAAYRQAHGGNLAPGAPWVGCCGSNNISGAPGTCVCGGDCGCSLNSACEDVLFVHRLLSQGPAPARSVTVRARLIGPDGSTRLDFTFLEQFPVVSGNGYWYFDNGIYASLTANLNRSGAPPGLPEIWEPGVYQLSFEYSGDMTGVAVVQFNVLSTNSLTHKECRSGSCQAVAGIAPDQCSSDLDCNHWECQGGRCVVVPTPGQSTCRVDADCVHYDCQGGKCVPVAGAGPDKCNPSQPQCTHRVCQSGVCIAVNNPDGQPGLADQCVDESQCTHTECQAGRCVTLPVPGQSQCLNDASCPQPPPPRPPPQQQPPAPPPPPASTPGLDPVLLAAALAFTALGLAYATRHR